MILENNDYSVETLMEDRILISTFLKGDGKGGFTAAPTLQNGIYIPYDTGGLNKIWKIN
jgi:hypothetical protein